jgi:adenylosuccinate synthase
MLGDLGNEVRELGKEYGASTGRPRRCGWFDSVVVRYANRVNGLDALAITKLDVLDTLKEIKVCTRYRYKGEAVEEFPGELSTLEECEPEYRTVPGWEKSTAGTKRAADLPKNARLYIELLEELSQVPVELVSTGPDRDSTIVDMGREQNLLERWFGA